MLISLSWRTRWNPPVKVPGQPWRIGVAGLPLRHDQNLPPHPALPTRWRSMGYSHASPGHRSDRSLCRTPSVTERTFPVIRTLPCRNPPAISTQVSPRGLHARLHHQAPPASAIGHYPIQTVSRCFRVAAAPLAPSAYASHVVLTVLLLYSPILALSSLPILLACLTDASQSTLLACTCQVLRCATRAMPVRPYSLAAILPDCSALVKLACFGLPALSRHPDRAPILPDCLTAVKLACRLSSIFDCHIDRL